MANFKVGDRIEILPNLMPDEERKRLENAISFSTKGKQSKSQVDQAAHQTFSELGTIEEVRKTPDGLSYLVRVELVGRPKGAPRLYTEDQAKKRFKAL